MELQRDERISDMSKRAFDSAKSEIQRLET